MSEYHSFHPPSDAGLASHGSSGGGNRGSPSASPPPTGPTGPASSSSSSIFRSKSPRKQPSRQQQSSPTDGALAGSLNHDAQFHTCPTCNGIGRVFGEESELVALIPYSDRRLKPRRTKLWVAISIIATVVTMGLCVFFLFPREVTMDMQVATTNYTINVVDPFALFIQHNVSFQNGNYYKVDVEDIRLEVQFLDLIIGNASLPTYSLGILDDAMVSRVVNASNIPAQFPYGVRVINSCLYPDYMIALQFTARARVNVLWQSQSLQATFTERVVCGQV